MAIEGMAFHKGEKILLKDAKVGVMTHALHYGTAVFEGIRGNWNSTKNQMMIFRLQEHYERLLRGANILRMNLPYSAEKLSDITDIFDKKSKGVIKKLMSRNELSGSLGNKVYLPNLNGTNSEKVYFMGCGKKDKEISEQEYLSLAEKIANAAIESNAKNVHIYLPALAVKGRTEDWNFKILARTLEASCYKYFFKGKGKNLQRNPYG